MRGRAVFLILAVAVTLAACSPAAKKASAPSPTTAVPVAPTTTGISYRGYLIASVHSAVAGYASPGGRIVTTVPASWEGAPSELAVVKVAGSWLDVRLATRPNESTAWVQMSSRVTLTQTQSRIVIDLADRHLELYQGGHIVLDAPAGIGTPTDPTPTGQFFVTFFAASPNSGYGPFVMVTSAHSDEITDWEESGDAVIAIHGPLGADAEIGTTGAAISHGCVRLHVSDLNQLRDVPAGAPVDIID